MELSFTIQGKANLSMTTERDMDICVAREYFDKIFDIITDFLRYRTLVGKGVMRTLLSRQNQRNYGNW